MSGKLIGEEVKLKRFKERLNCIISKCLGCDNCLETLLDFHYEITNTFPPESIIPIWYVMKKLQIPPKYIAYLNKDLKSQIATAS